VMAAYHHQQGELEIQSREALVIRALIRLAKLHEVDVWTSMDVMDVSSETLTITASQVVEVAKAILAKDDGSGEEDESLPWVNTRSVGRLLSRLRLKDMRGEPPKRERLRIISPKEILKLVLAHHVVHLAEETSSMSTNVQTSSAEPRPSDPEMEPPPNVNGPNGTEADCPVHTPTTADADGPTWEEGDV
jgi:hypothetical protein